MSVEPTNSSEPYEQIFQGVNYTNSDCPSCKELMELRAKIVALQQLKIEYWPRPCWRDWPCLFTQHRSEIDKRIETLKPREQDLELQCRAELDAEKRAKKAQQMMAELDKQAMAAKNQTPGWLGWLKG